MITRRHFGLTAASAFASVALGEGCAATRTRASNEGRLMARPRGDAKTTLTSGPLGLASDRDGLVQMPTHSVEGKLPLLVFLHGATQRAAGMVRRMGPAADQAGVVLVAPDSRDTTWNAIPSGFGEAG